MAERSQTKRRGFPGLSDLASEVKLAYEANANTTANISSSTLGAAVSSAVNPTPSPFAFLSSPNTWGWGVVAVIFIVWLMNTESKPPRQTLTPRAASQNSPPRQTQPPRTTSTNSPSSNTNTSSAPLYERPPVGTDHALSVSQIRWALREGIRIEAMQDFIDTNDAVEKFNKIVNDYNSRAAQFRYYERDMQRAKSDVEAARSKIVAEAKKEALEWNNFGKNISVPTPPASQNDTNVSRETPEREPKDVKSANRKLAKAEIMEVQQILSDLGYAPGSIDGKAGTLTISAVKAFQKDAGVIQNGKIDPKLFDLLWEKHFEYLFKKPR
ncbi:MAG: peptidoglycan-binding protein [Synergistaceae bacterium]|jgi:hypothetical protein|nr:peptidoglycan-binding protein [Synergistaceae bacterium]